MRSLPRSLYLTCLSSLLLPGIIACSAEDSGPIGPTIVSSRCVDANGEIIVGAVAAGGQYEEQLLNEIGEVVNYTVYEPTVIQCQEISDGAHPLLVYGGEFTSFAEQLSIDEQISEYRNDGMAVLVVEYKGMGSEGNIDFVSESEIRNTIYAMDAVESDPRFDFLSWYDDATNQFIERPEVPESIAGGANLKVAAVGSGYGGSYQLMLNNIDDKKRLDIINVDSAWFDLNEVLNPNNTPRTKVIFPIFLPFLDSPSDFFALIPTSLQQFFEWLTGDFEDSLPPSTTADAKMANEILASTTLRGRIDPEYQDYFKARSSTPFCDGRINNVASNNIPVTLLTQGVDDSVVGLNSAIENFRCLKNRKANLNSENDVYFIGHHGGYRNDNFLRPFLIPSYSLTTGESCGEYNISNFKRSLLNNTLFGEEIPRKYDALKNNACLKLSDSEAVMVSHDSLLQDIRSNPAIDNQYKAIDINADEIFRKAIKIPLIGSGIFANGVAHNVSFLTINEASIIAGIPKLSVKITPTNNTHLCGKDCDVELHFGLSIVKGGTGEPELIDEQTVPARGTHVTHDIDLTGVVARLDQGDKLFLSVFSRRELLDGGFEPGAAFVNHVDIDATIDLPVYSLDSNQISISTAD